MGGINGSLFAFSFFLQLHRDLKRNYDYDFPGGLPLHCIYSCSQYSPPWTIQPLKPTMVKLVDCVCLIEAVKLIGTLSKYFLDILNVKNTHMQIFRPMHLVLVVMLWRIKQIWAMVHCNWNFSQIES